MTIRTLLSHLTDDELIRHAESERNPSVLEAELLKRFEQFVRLRSSSKVAAFDYELDDDVV